MKDEHRTWLDVIPLVIERDVRSKVVTERLQWPAWKMACEFDLCYTIIQNAVAQGRRDLVYAYTDWIERKLGCPYDQMIEWAERNGWPSLGSVWKSGSRNCPWLLALSTGHHLLLEHVLNGLLRPLIQRSWALRVARLNNLARCAVA